MRQPPIASVRKLVALLGLTEDLSRLLKVGLLVRNGNQWFISGCLCRGDVFLDSGGVDQPTAMHAVKRAIELAEAEAAERARIAETAEKQHGIVDLKVLIEVVELNQNGQRPWRPLIGQKAAAHRLRKAGGAVLETNSDGAPQIHRGCPLRTNYGVVRLRRGP
jgi:hypothetical protein